MAGEARGLATVCGSMEAVAAGTVAALTSILAAADDLQGEPSRGLIDIEGAGGPVRVSSRIPAARTRTPTVQLMPSGS
jgi:hypothetical protein